MGVIKRKKHSTSPTVEPSQEEKEFEDRCRENLKIANLNWLICSNCLSLFLYVCHIGWNVYWLIFKQEKDWWYLGFWLTSAVVVTVRSFLFYNDEKTYGPRDRLPEESYLAWWSKWVLGLVCPIPRYWDLIKYARQAKQAKLNHDASKNIYFTAMIWEDAELTQLRQFNSFLESAPQLLLKLYIALKGGSHFGVKSAIFKIFTIVSLAWALVTYDQKICLMDGVKKSGNANQRNRSNGITIDFNNDAAINCIKDVNWTNSAILFLANFLWIVGRLMALSLFASAYGWIIWPVCLAHLIPIFVWHLETNYTFMDSLRLSFIHLFAYLYPTKKVGEKEPDAHPRFSPAMYQSVCMCENVILMILWMESFSKGDDGPLDIKICWIIQFVTTLTSFALFWWVKEINKMRKRDTDSSPTQTEDQPTPETALTLSP